MQAQHSEARPDDETPHTVEVGAFARKAAVEAQERHERAGDAQSRLAERRVRYQESVIRREIRQAQRENERAEALEREQVEADAADDADFMRAQIVPMLEDGWTLEQLEEIGITGEMLAKLGLLHDAARRAPRPAPRAPRRDGTKDAVA